MIIRLLKEALAEAFRAEEEFGRNESAEFACCRIAEEVGELIQAATATSKDRGNARAPRVWKEAVQSVAMIIRLMREYPGGKP